MKLTPEQRKQIMDVQRNICDNGGSWPDYWYEEHWYDFAIRCAEILNEKELKELKKYRERDEEAMAYHGWSKSHETK